jgi:hypothetical protein
LKEQRWITEGIKTKRKMEKKGTMNMSSLP